MAGDDQKKLSIKIQWDTEERRDLVSEKEGHIRDSVMYLTASLYADMLSNFGGVVTNVKTSTNVDTGEVLVAKAKPKEPGAVLLRQVGSGSAEFSFFRPLKKLDLKVPPNRQFNVTPVTAEVPGVGTVYIFPMSERRNVPRNRKEEADAHPDQAKQPEDAAAHLCDDDETKDE